VLRRKLRRSQVLSFFAKLPPTVIGMEACGAAHYWAGVAQARHEVKLMAPQHVKAYVSGNKNDGAMPRDYARHEPADDAVRAVKSEEQQAALMLAGFASN